MLSVPGRTIFGVTGAADSAPSVLRDPDPWAKRFSERRAERDVWWLGS
jgi:hypothetical protein